MTNNCDTTKKLIANIIKKEKIDVVLITIKGRDSIGDLSQYRLLPFNMIHVTSTKTTKEIQYTYQNQNILFCNKKPDQNKLYKPYSSLGILINFLSFNSSFFQPETSFIDARINLYRAIEKKGGQTKILDMIKKADSKVNRELKICENKKMNYNFIKNTIIVEQNYYQLYFDNKFKSTIKNMIINFISSDATNIIIHLSKVNPTQNVYKDNKAKIAAILSYKINDKNYRNLTVKKINDIILTGIIMVVQQLNSDIGKDIIEKYYLKNPIINGKQKVDKWISYYFTNSLYLLSLSKDEIENKFNITKDQLFIVSNSKIPDSTRKKIIDEVYNNRNCFFENYEQAILMGANQFDD